MLILEENSRWCFEAFALNLYFSSAGQRLIVINRIQNKSFCEHNICVCAVYIYYVYKYTHMHVHI